MRHEPYKQIKHRGYVINIYTDDDPESPRQWDNLGTMYTAHRHYRPEEEFDDHFDIDEVFESRWVFSNKFLREYIALPVYMYDHGGQTVSTTPFSCQWDSGLFGIIAVPIEVVKKEYGWKNLTSKRRISIEQHLKSEVEIYDNYITGEVYRFEINPKDDEEYEIDSCSGFYGYNSLKTIEEMCKSFIDEIHRKEAIQRVVNYWKHAVQLCLPFPEYQLQTL